MSILDALYPSSQPLLTSLAFLLLILPVMLAVYYLLPVRARVGWLFAASLCCYYLAEGGVRLLLLVGCIAIDYAVVRLLGVFDGRRGLRLGIAAASVGKTLGLLAWFSVMAARGAAPAFLGLQLYALASIGVVLLTYRNQIPVERNPFRFGLYCSFFPALYAGPLAVYETFAKEAGGPRLQIHTVLSGLGETAEGAFKAAVIGGSMVGIYREILAMERLEPASASALSSWCLVLSAALALYYGLSGLSDMARGIGLAFGFRLPKNFYYPYQSRSVEDFAQRFNITIHRFFEEFLRVIPERFGILAECGNTLLIGLFMGLWFGVRGNTLLWGAYFSLWILAEKYLYPGLLRRVPLLFCRIATLFVVLGGFTILFEETASGSLSLIRRMLDSSGAAGDRILYLLSSNWLILAIACFFATNAASLLVGLLRKAAPRVASVVMGAVDLGLFALFIALTF